MGGDLISNICSTWRLSALVTVAVKAIMPLSDGIKLLISVSRVKASHNVKPLLLCKELYTITQRISELSYLQYTPKKVLVLHKQNAYESNRFVFVSVEFAY